MMRVVAGKYRSRVLRSLRGLVLRPTSDRLRETLFNILGATIEGSVFVDVYAGSGAVGIEALSRGAKRVIFIENHAPAVRQIGRNLEALGINAVVSGPGASAKRAWFGEGPPVEILATDALVALEHLEARRVHAHFVFLDPPYEAVEEYARSINYLDSSTLLTPAGFAIVEHGRWLPLPEGFTQLERVRLVEQGASCLSFYCLSLAA